MHVARRTVPASGSTPREISRRAEALVANPLVAYGAIIALQLRVIWNVWNYKDLTAGDTAGYFTEAISWTNHLQDNIVWSPLYTNFWGTIMAVVNNIYAAAMAHRVAIVIAAAILILALMRRLLHPALALLVASWWAVVPANFNVLYEVHLFGALPILLAAVLVARVPGRKDLGVALALLAGTTFLLRNEMIVATLILGGTIVIYELRRRRTRHTPASTYLLTYGVPLAIVFLLVAGFYWRSGVQGHQFLSEFRTKQDLNLCQVYSFNFQQRHPSRFRGNAFTECRPLMQQTFGQPTPSLVHATLTNFDAVAGMMKWNLQLWPSGVQVALFNAASTGDQPDYIPFDTHSDRALMLSFAVLALLIAGGWAIRRDSEFWRREWLAPRVWAVIVFGAVAVTTFVVVLTQRPRPEYMYGLTVGIMTLTGICLQAVLRRVNALAFAAPVAIAVSIGLIVAVPSYYHKGPRPVRDAVEHLQPISSSLRQRGSVLLVAQSDPDICYYMAASFNRYCSSPSWPAMQARLAAGTPIDTVLSQAKVSAIYAEPALLGDPSIARLVANPQRYGWRQAAGGVGEGGPWNVLVRTS
jgi:hypothetical protein